MQAALLEGSLTKVTPTSSVVSVTTSAKESDTNTLKVGISHFPPYCIVNHSSSGELQVSGFIVELWEDVAKRSGLAFEYHLSTKKKNIRLLKEGKLDLIASGYMRSFASSLKIQYTQAFWFSGLGILVKDPRFEELPISRFFKKIFTTQFFIGVTVLILALVLSGMVFCCAEGTTVKPEDEEFLDPRTIDDDSMMKRLGVGIWWSAATITTVGYGDVVPKSRPGLCFGAVWVFAALFVYSSFTAHVTADMTISDLNVPISSFSQLAFHKVGVLQGSFAERYIRKRFPLVQVQPYQTPLAYCAALVAGNVTAVVGVSDVLRYMDTNSRYAEETVVVGHPQHMHGIVLPFAQHAPEALVTGVGMAALEDKMLDGLAKKYFNLS
eukprot:CAMPEP_0175123682 /NCGR_PEP_ID=MMETSP0087-20121206/2377_1 /TAXON_ID=136419 /ORGANISM="Unknown Unknown, Strain D1" /LENGTH=380 /DNA_ID=CAMNT_0016405397 /DNA_START=132 /DNA_END=1275 /DNA_ORIENTATION=-